jgi:hypothetical protein
MQKEARHRVDWRNAGLSCSDAKIKSCPCDMEQLESLQRILQQAIFATAYR